MDDNCNDKEMKPSHFNKVNSPPQIRLCVLEQNKLVKILDKQLSDNILKTMCKETRKPINENNWHLATNNKITISPELLSKGEAGKFYGPVWFSVSGGEPPYTFEVVQGVLPSQLELTSEGNLSGLLTQKGEFPFSILVKDNRGYSVIGEYNLQVIPSSMVIYPENLSPAEVGKNYGPTRFVVTNGTPPFNFAITEGELPLHLELTSQGELSGIPHRSGNYGFTVTATDKYSFHTSRHYTLQVNTPKLTLSPSSLPDGMAGEMYGPVIFSVAGGVPPYRFSMAGGIIPSGLILTETGELSGIINETGMYSFSIVATDKNNLTALGNYTLSISKLVSLPLHVEPQVIRATLGDPNIQLKITGGNGGHLEYIASNEHVIQVDNHGYISFHHSGDASITVRQAETENHFAPQPATVPVIVYKKSVCLDITLKQNMYVGENQLIQIHSNSGGEVRYGVDDNGTLEVTPQGILYAKNPGEGIINCFIKETDDYYEGSFSYLVTVKIRKPIISGIPEYLEVLTVNLADTGLDVAKGVNVTWKADGIILNSNNVSTPTAKYWLPSNAVGKRVSVVVSSAINTTISAESDKTAMVMPGKLVIQVHRKGMIINGIIPQIGDSLSVNTNVAFKDVTAVWKRDGIVYCTQQNVSLFTVKLELTDLSLIGHQISVELIDANNPLIRAESEPTIPIHGTPSVSNVIISGEVVYGNTLTLTSYDFHSNGAGTDNSTYQWYGEHNGNLYNITGATGKTLKTNTGHEGYRLHVRITPKGTLGGEGDIAISNKIGPMTTATPAIENIRVLGAPKVGNTLTVDYDFLANGAGNDNSIYQWFYWDEYKGGFTEITDGNGTGKSFLISNKYQNMEIKVYVRARGSLEGSREGNILYSDPIRVQ
ncbi:Ig domain-containing protein [Serratia sp. AKBS12]|uniref:Ig domain-containing protein n=1 Tax=Serratia sp. AKBS12 TaxID=2974597 RepID=UPI00216638B1|nr:Ig domain-containing protein [Serratia sp. AKBS12]MCS3409318.1 Ig domain-containing protein [Serratia sp. AKBS12]